MACAVLVPRGRQGQPVRRVLSDQSASQALLVRRAPLDRLARKALPVNAGLQVPLASAVQLVRRVKLARRAPLDRLARKAQPVNAGLQVPLASAVQLVRRGQLASVGL